MLYFKDPWNYSTKNPLAHIIGMNQGRNLLELKGVTNEGKNGDNKENREDYFKKEKNDDD